MIETEDRFTLCETIREEETCRDEPPSVDTNLLQVSGHGKERRNSIPSITSLLNFTASIHSPHRSSRSSVPNITLHPPSGSSDDREKYRQSSFPSYRSGGSTSLHNSPSIKSRFKLYHYIKAGAVDQYNDLYKLDDTFAQIRSQLNCLSEENRTVRTRVHSLSEAVTELCSHYSSTGSADDEELDELIDDLSSSDDDEQDMVHSNVMIPFQRTHSQPVPYSNGWHEEDTTNTCINTHSNNHHHHNDMITSSWQPLHNNEQELLCHIDRIPACIITVNSQEYDDTSEEETCTTYKDN